MPWRVSLEYMKVKRYEAKRMYLVLPAHLSTAIN